jgi:hypothetical protein
MGCGCGRSQGEPAESFVVTRPDGTTKETATRVEADIEVTRAGGGTITVTKAPE